MHHRVEHLQAHHTGLAVLVVRRIDPALAADHIVPVLAAGRIDPDPVPAAGHIVLDPVPAAGHTVLLQAVARTVLVRAAGHIVHLDRAAVRKAIDQAVDHAVLAAGHTDPDPDPEPDRAAGHTGTDQAVADHNRLELRTADQEDQAAVRIPPVPAVDHIAEAVRTAGLERLGLPVVVHSRQAAVGRTLLAVVRHTVLRGDLQVALVPLRLRRRWPEGLVVLGQGVMGSGSHDD
jgi:hypothetical protein